MVKPSVQAVDVDPKTGTTLGFYAFGQDRPNVLIIAAMDGLSATGVYCTYLIMKHLEDLGRIDGSITLLPVANPLAFRLGTQVSPLDSKDLDTTFPGDEHGTITERIAWEIWRKVSQADYVIHISTGQQPCVSHVVAMHRDYIHVRNLASQLALQFVVQSPGQRGSLTTEAAHEGIPVATIETRGNRYEIDAQAAVELKEVILNFLRIKEMMPGEHIEASGVFTATTHQVIADTEGFFIPGVSLGDEVVVGDVIGQIQDKSQIASPFDGKVISASKLNYVFEGDIIARIASPLVEKRTTEEEETPSVPKRRKW